MVVVATPDTAVPAEGRQRVLDVAADLFVRQGFDGASQRDIASAAGMKAASLYYHFASKNELAQAVFERGIEIMVEAFDAASATTAGADGRTRIGAHVRAHLAALFENGPYTAAHVTSFRTAPAEVRDAVVAVRDGYEAMWTELFTELVASGDFATDIDIGLTRLTLFGAMNTSIEWFDPDRGNLDDLADHLTRLVWEGLH